MPREDAVPGLLSFFLVALLGFDQGGWAPASWVWSAALLAVAAGVLFTGRARWPSGLELGFLVALAGLLAWTLLSIVWSLDPTASVLEAQRLLLYAAVAAAVLLLARPSSRAPILAGVLAAAGLLCLAGLADVLVGDDPVGAVSADPGSPLRLSEPLGYANAVALLAAMSVLLALGVSAWTSVTAARGACLALVPLLVATVYFTYGRGAWIALAFGLVAAIAAGPGRKTLALTALVVAPAGLAAVGVAAAVENHAALAALLALCAAVATTGAALLPALERRSGRPLAFAAGGAALVAAAAVIVAAGGPIDLARDARRSFTGPSATPSTGSGRLLTLSGSSRTDYWRVARRDVREHPVLGSGAGSYGRYWIRHRPVPQPARDAHSLYLEMLAELGPIGLLLLLAALGLPLATLRAPDPLVPAAVGPYVAYLAHSAQDWDWELPAVTVAAILCAVALLLASRDHGAPLPRRARLAGGAAAAALAAVALAAYPGNRELAVAETGSESAARRAARLQPWSAEPWRLLGEARLTRGEVEGARTAFLEGLERDDGDWELWLDLALASEGPERADALREARELNPRDPDLAELAAE